MYLTIDLKGLNGAWRRFSTFRIADSQSMGRLIVRSIAGWKPAKRQTGSLRYGL